MDGISQSVPWPGGERRIQGARQWMGDKGKREKREEEEREGYECTLSLLAIAIVRLLSKVYLSVLYPFLVVQIM